ncbi:Rqc2 family fibronectin-binding protein [Lachnobacterium bovis]|uniref:Rqc2 homolog RqcH n=1 Tax=Lachnobacterium bovis TaxID=140626 RepID=A0A1H9QR13_9FIRM|nr:NFACT RNA binding domain-containing protein [Lachnobacterium bovis]SER62183.1 Predicted component of the ribosome quality control (RQC) complex, YloA/Tae2 family, contains fibronectin-binding (FbpA) and DUF814 domains [Lachnobacterium bovis]
MAFDGIVISNLVHELNNTILNSRISKISQPEKDELLLTFKGTKGSTRLLISVNASLPFMCLTNENKTAPLQAPTFCMVLRKHIANGRITKIYQPNFDRIIHFDIEHLDEMGDLSQKTLIVELMGKHSNIIFCDKDNTIINSIKHVSCLVSSLREVLPGRKYFIPNTQGNKINPFEINNSDELFNIIISKPLSVIKAIYTSFNGISPLIASEICYRSGIDGDSSVSAFTADELKHVSNCFFWFIEDLKNNKFQPCIIRENKVPIEFSSVTLTQYQDYVSTNYDSISEVLEIFYKEKNIHSRIRQKSYELRHIVTTSLERNQKKLSLQTKQLKDTNKRDKFRVYGELINSYGYNLDPDAKFLEAPNYYDDNKIIKIPLDPTITPQENSKKYFDKYQKLKRTYEALTELIEDTDKEIKHLESIQASIDIATSSDDLIQIKEELIDFGYIKKHKNNKKIKTKSKPFHYVSSDGYDIYVGKNNYQNDQLTFKFATGNDWWFHAKGMPGSHVIVKSNNSELPDRVFEEAGSLAAYYSSGRENEKVEVDYLQKKNVKKPNSGAPGFVVYYTNYSLIAIPDISNLKKMD